MSLSICNEKNWEVTTNLERLRNINTVPQGPRHNPVNHGEALDLFKNRLIDNNISITKESGLLSHDDLKYVYTAVVKDDTISDYGFTLGFINFNNRVKSFTGLFGETVFVCSNEMFKGETIRDNKRHTKNVWERLTGKVDSIVERFNIFREERFNEIEVMKQRHLEEPEIGKIVLDMHRRHIMSNTNIDRFVREVDTPTHSCFKDPSVWNIQNAFTEIAKNISEPTRRIDATDSFHQLLLPYIPNAA